MYKYIPNLLTILRLLLVPVFPMVYFSGSKTAMTHALFIFIIAGFTDFLDGYIARRFNLTSVVGTALDPLADKLMLLTTLTCLYLSGYLPLVIIAIMYLKELTMMLTGLYMYFRKEKLVVSSNIFGKLATLIFSIAVVLTMLKPTGQLHLILLYTALLFKLTAFSSYAIHFFKHTSKVMKH
ncbi:MAG: CDP-diacylglycerol--glycerol-3-phosphate 3-phosphatidyltransferase [Clostridia bacterium]|nr:CDP-diacylglycerol--glycerol-3-phosphate 3-phosphatidyltransferase [Clostridia bacterium]